MTQNGLGRGGCERQKRTLKGRTFDFPRSYCCMSMLFRQNLSVDAYQPARLLESRIVAPSSGSRGSSATAARILSGHGPSITVT